MKRVSMIEVPAAWRFGDPLGEFKKERDVRVKLSRAWAGDDLLKALSTTIEHLPDLYEEPILSYPRRGGGPAPLVRAHGLLPEIVFRHLEVAYARSPGMVREAVERWRAKQHPSPPPPSWKDPDRLAKKLLEDLSRVPSSSRAPELTP